MVQEINMNALDTYLKANGGLERKVIIELMSREFEQTGMFGHSEYTTLTFDRLRVWADGGMVEIFQAIPGVMRVQQDKAASVCYAVSIDPRYNTKWVMAEIEAVAQLHEPTQPEPAPDLEAGEWTQSFLTSDTTNT
jgi:hypothetical protein